MQQSLFAPGVPRESWFVTDVMLPIRVGTKDGPIVDPSGECSCGKRGCWHSGLVADIRTKGAKCIPRRGLKYELKSAFHKEIRRGDVAAALRWARWGAYYYGKAWPKTYAKSILLEEGRSVRLVSGLSSLAGFGWEAVSAQVAAMRKKWEMPSRAGVFADYVEAFVASIGEPILESGADTADAFETALNRLDMLRVFWRTQRPSFSEASAARWMVNALYDRAVAQGGAAEAWVKGTCWKAHYLYGPKTLIEMLTGGWTEAANEIDETSSLLPEEEEIPFLPSIPVYTHDCHVLEGKRRLRKHWRKLLPGQPLPPGVDLRWSGMLLGVCWREFAFEQFPEDFRDRQWEEVEIPAEVWKNVLACDRYLYPNFYGAITPSSHQDF